MNRVRIQFRTRGLTLVELLVVVGIIVLLVGILTPMGMRAYRNSEISRIKMDLQAISAALEAYKQDHNSYPRNIDYTADPSGDEYRGARLLAWALIGPGDAAVDGAEGPGFRTRRMDGTPQGRVYGPYLNIDSFILTSEPDNPDAGITTVAPVMLDKMRQPILYFPASGNKNLFVGASETPPFPYYNYADNSAAASDLERFAAMLGDQNGDGRIAGNESARTTLPFLLWCAGPDGEFGPAGTTAQDVDACDDITNFTD